MCGIAGVVALTDRAPPPPREPLLRMAGALTHRGPDGHGVYRDSRAGLAHARLAIIDVPGGQQPLANEDDTLWIVFNGEIFNYVELRAELEALGHRFRTRSDTEVIVHAYEAWGDDAFARFNGQWAVALWDAPAERLVLSRDRVGVRPLYVCEHRDCLYFASEVKALFAADRSIPRAFDATGLAQTFTFWSSIAPRTVFHGIEELKPGAVRTYEGGRMTERLYWQPEFGAAGAGYGGTFEAAADSVREALENATALRVLRSDVPVGSYLSGGLDSAIVAAMGREVAGDRFNTFSLRFTDAEYDETPFQRIMAERLGTEHHEIVVDRRDIADVFPAVVLHAERPLLRTAPAPLFLLSRLVRSHGIKVVLTGEGADEMFAGYDLFKEGQLRRFWAREPGSAARPMLLEKLYPYLARSPVAQRGMARRFFGRDLASAGMPGFAHQTRWATTAALQRFFGASLKQALDNVDVVDDYLGALPAGFSSWPALSQDQYIESSTLLSGYLLSAQGDRMLMANSVEGRFPFLDARVMALANALPPRFKLRALREKRVLKEAARGLVPPEIVSRHKQPYRAPDAASFASPGAPDYVEDMLAPIRIAEAGVFEPAAVRRLWNKCKERSGAGELSNSDNMALVGILSTQLLHHQLVCSAPQAQETAPLAVDVDKTHVSA